MTAGNDWTPIIIIGAARSGTKLIRGLIAAHPAVCAVPYDVPFVWRYGNEFLPHDAIPPERATPRVRRYIRKQLGRMARIQRHPDARFVVEKTVGNTLRVPFVADVLPDARFVHVVRDGRAVTESAMRMWQEPPQAKYLLEKLRYFPFSNVRYAFWYAWNIAKGRLRGSKGVHLWGPRYPGIEEDVHRLSLVEVCATQWRMSVEYARRDLAGIAPDRKIEVRYETLLDDPSVTDRLAEALGLDDAGPMHAYYSQTVRRDTKDKWQEGLTDQQQASMMKIIRPTLEELGYLDASAGSGTTAP